MKLSRIREIIKEELSNILLESMSRYAEIWKASDGKWYLDLASEEYGEYEDAYTYGPFMSEKSVEQYLRKFPNPGGWGSDGSGKQKPPKESPNGRPVIRPRF